MDWIQGVTLGIAVVGATLGVFNAAWMIRKDTVRLRVSCVIEVTNTGLVTAAIEVINTGYIPVTITEVAFTSARNAKNKLVIINDCLNRCRLPHRLEARASMTVAAAPLDFQHPQMAITRYCHAKTACEVIVRSRIRAWRNETEFSAIARAARQEPK